DLLPHGLQRDPEGLEGLGCDALTLVDEAQQDVLGTDEVVVEQARFLLSEDEHSSGSVCEAFEQLPASWEGCLHGLILPVAVQFLALLFSGPPPCDVHPIGGGNPLSVVLKAGISPKFLWQ